jgi:predicted outer membrane lipoprotein
MGMQVFAAFAEATVLACAMMMINATFQTHFPHRKRGRDYGSG